MLPRASFEALLPFTEHLEELRRRLVICLLALTLGTLAGWFLAPHALRLLIIPLEKSGQFHPEAEPISIDVRVDAGGHLRIRVPTADQTPASILDHARANPDRPIRLELRPEGAAPDSPPSAVIGNYPPAGLIYLNPLDPIMLLLKISIGIGILIALPVLLWQVWSFIEPALKPRERRWIGPLLISALALFPLGASFAYFGLSYALQLFASYSVKGLAQQLNVMEYLSFVLTTMVSFGIVFELPVVVVVGTRLGFISHEFLARRRREVFVLVLIASAIITPTVDPFSMMAMAVPLYVLFEISIWIARWLETKDQAPEQETES